MPRTYQNGLTGERRTVSDPAEHDWYEKNPPWYRVEEAGPAQAYPPSERTPGKAKPKT